ncbi:MAG: hypothetical protein K9K64_04495 [Desulfohalobiaceae bacterium]|nr:hypothetical protein [Desulfohalobiaceae bacterium]
MTKTPSKDQLLEKACTEIKNLFQQVGWIDEVAIQQEIRRGDGPDFVVELTGREGSRVLLIESRVSGEPRLAREAVNSLLLEMKLWSRGCPVFVAPYISPEAAEICRANKVGYLDLAGNCYLAFDSLFIRTQGRPNPFKSRRNLKSLSKPKSERVIRVLLNNARRQWQTLELAREAEVSPGLVSNVKKILRDKEWIEEKKRRICLTRPRSLLEEWIRSAPDPGEAVHSYTAPFDFIGIENAIVERCRKMGLHCAFTGLSGAVHLASGIDYRQVQAYIDGDPEILAAETGFEKKGGEPNVVLLQTRDEGVFYGSRQVMPASRLQYSRPAEKTVQSVEEEIRTRLQIVSPIQIYHDLRATLRQQGPEAERLLEQVINPSW